MSCPWDPCRCLWVAGGLIWGFWASQPSLLQAQQETQKAALRYERAVSMHNAAREMVFVAEQGVMADKNRLDPTWQEMLNHATCKVSPGQWPLRPCLFPLSPLLSIHFLTPLSLSLLPSSLPSALILFHPKPVPHSPLYLAPVLPIYSISLEFRMSFWT